MYPRILVPIDGSAASRRGLREAIAIGAALKSTLVILHVFDDFPFIVGGGLPPEYENRHTALLKSWEGLLDKGAKLAADAGVQSDRVLRDVKAVPVADVIVEESVARQCDLIVMGTHGRRGLKRLTMGSDAEIVLRHAPVPVLLVREPDEPDEPD
jgi:nucleotide-binding universal stress UspA family protein